MKKFNFKTILMTLMCVVGLGISPNAWAGYNWYGKVYFVAPDSWDQTNVQIGLRQENGYTDFDGNMQCLNNKLYYVWLSKDHGTWGKEYVIFVGNSSQKNSGYYGSSKEATSSDFTCYTKVCDYGVASNDNYYTFTSPVDGAKQGASLSGDWASDKSNMQKNQTVTVQIKGSSGYSNNTSSTKGGKVKQTCYYFTNDASVSETSNSNVYTSQTYNNAALGTLATLEVTSTASGYQFEGWYDSDGNLLSSNTTYTYTVRNTTTIYARFTPIYTISYAAGTVPTGGVSISGSKSNETKTYGVSFTLPSSAVFTTTGYTQKGWATSSLGSKSYELGGSYTTNAAQTFYPYWNPNSYSITYLDGGGSDFSGTHETDYPTTHTYGTETSLKSASKPSYRFDGWFDNSDCTGSAITTLGATAYTSNITLYAKWTLDEVYYDVASGVKSFAGMTAQDDKATLSISATSGTYKSDTKKVLKGSVLQFTVSNIATGYAIEGWYSDDACSVKIAGAGTSDTYTTPAVDGDVSVYVKILATQYNITYNNVYGTNPNPSSYNVEDEITFQLITEYRTGYTFDGWSPASITKGTTGAQTVTAQWQAKTYTIALSDNGGTGGLTSVENVTFAAAMPTITTLPTRVGYKFNGYWSQQSGGKKYYNANGTSASNWDIDQENPTLYAQWTQLYCFIEGRFHVATDKTRTSWTNTFDGSGSDNWYTESTKIKFTWNETNKRYELATNATLKDLSTQISGFDPYFFIKQSTSSSSLANVKSYNHDGTLSSEEGVKNAMNAASDKSCKFNSQDRSGYVTICFDEKDIWFELEKVTLYDVTVQSFNGGSVDPSGTHKIGEISWTITANASDGYHFNRWTTTGGASVENATSASTKVTATANGTVTANFAANTNLYFQKPGSWTGSEVWVYFDAWWDDDKGAGSSSKPAGKKMSDLGNGTYCLTYSGSEAGSSNIAFVNGKQDGYDPFYGTSVSYRGDFKHCSSNNWFIPENKQTKKYDDRNTAYYNDGYWTSYYDRVEYYFMNSRSNPSWTQLDEYRFKNTDDHEIKRLEIQNVTAGENIAFRIWQTCDCWFGVESKGCVIKEDTKNYGVRTGGNENVTLQAWKAGSYEIILHTNSNTLDVTYLGDITVANFPGEVSTFKDRQHKIKPDVTLRNGTAVTDVAIKVAGHDLPWTSSYATYEQNGTNLVITGKALGSETVTVRYQNNKREPYIVDRTLKVNVATPIVIQAMLEKDEDNDESTKDDYWSNTGLVHIHFWGSDATKTQDMAMSYNKDTKVFSVTAPKIDDFKFLFWYGEDINMSANEAWRKTQDITSCTTNTCYSISYGKDKNTTRTATAKPSLCTTDEYYVEITMKNGNTYKSNTIDNLDKEVSFFAPKDNDETTYMQGTVRIVYNGAVSDPVTGFDAAGVYVAKINNTANGFESKSLYTGNYYIRTDGAHGAWGDYKTDADNLMIPFTPRAEKGETYSYYWVKNVAKNGDQNDGKTNVKADIANDYNDNLAGMIENDKFTDGGGFVYNSANGANVRFSYEPTTNEFKRAILGGAGNNNFLNVYSKTNNLYADNEYSKQLSESADLNDSKFSDLSDWVYEKRVYVRADGEHASNVILKSVFNGQTTHLLGYQINSETGEETDVPNELEVMGSQSTGDFALRITYDFKKNRLIASWEPGQREISENMTIDSDVLFVQQEDADGTIDNTDVAQITYSQTGINANAKLTSLKNMIYVLEVTDKVINNTDADNQLYWICLPFDCRISDIFGVEGYVKLDASGHAISGTWGIQRYDGTTRAAHGWFEDDNPEGFWKWMTRDEELKAGTGYVVVFDKTGASSWPSIDVEEACTTGDDCVEGKHTVKKRSKRLYFPSIGSKFEICYSGSSANVVEYADEPCNVTKPYNRSQYDGNWKVIGPVSYNNIGVDQGATKNLIYYYTYSQSNAYVGNKHYQEHTVAADTELKSFHGYMTQFGGDLTWKPFTKSEDVTTPIVQAPRYLENPEFKGGMLTIELNNAQGTQLDRTFVNLHKNGTLGFDQNMELTKISENCAQIASVNEDVLYAGSTLPLDIEMVPLNVKVVANGTYDIALAQSLEGLEVRLYDAFEQTTTPLDLMSATVTLDKGEYKDRFFLQFVQKSPLTPTNFDGALEQINLPSDKTQKLLINDQIYLINAGRVYNAMGVER